MAKGKILVVDDEEHILELIRYNLDASGYEVIEASDGDDAVKKAINEVPDLILLDLMLPGKDGYDVCRELRSNGKTKAVPIIMLTAKSEEIDKILGLELGADDYITKPFIVDELVARVKAHLRREKRRNSIGNNIIKIGEIEIHKDSYEVYLNKELIDLSTREFQLFLYLCENAGQVLSREQIFNSVWGSDFGDIGTVAVNIKSLRDKIDKENKYIKTIWGVGYKLIKPIGEVI